MQADRVEKERIETGAREVEKGPEMDATRVVVKLRQEVVPSEPAEAAHAAIVGIWAPDSGTCSARNLREGLLPAIINTDGAWAGETFCTFKNQKQTDTEWRVVATCSNPRERWTANV